MFMMGDREALACEFVVPEVRGKQSEQPMLVQHTAGVEPGSGDHRVLVQRLVDDVAGAAQHPVFELLGIPFFGHAETAKLPFRMIVIAVAVTIVVDQPVSGDMVDRLDPRQALHREMQRGRPRPAGLLVLDIEAGRWRIFQAHLLA